MICSKCGASLPNNTSTVCPQCGTFNDPSKVHEPPPASDCVIRTGRSPLVLIAAILYTLSIVISLMNSLSNVIIINVFYGIASFLDLQSELSHLLSEASYASMIAATVISSIPAVIFAVGIWLIYAGSSRRSRSSKLSTGLKTISFMVSLFIVLISIAFAVGILTLYVFVRALTSSIEDTVLPFLILAAIFTFIFVLVICYFKGIKKTVKAAHYSLYSNVPSKGSVYVIIVNFFISAFFLVIGLINSVGYSVFDNLSRLDELTDPVFPGIHLLFEDFGGTVPSIFSTAERISPFLTSVLFLLFAILIIVYRSRMSSLVRNYIGNYAHQSSDQPARAETYRPQPKSEPEPKTQVQPEPMPHPQPQTKTEPEPQSEPQFQPQFQTRRPPAANIFADPAPSPRQTAAAATMPTPTLSEPSWTCSCGNFNFGSFCTECGKKRPDSTWTCSCGNVNSGSFCTECGKKRPE